MATTSINKIVRGNLNLKPWIAAKNTTEIVNSYVQKFYKQIPDNFKNDLFKPRLSAPKTENRIPLRKVFPEKFNIPIISNKPTSKLRSNGYRSPPITTKNSFVTAPKRILKNPNFKIYTKRRYASSISSSKSSFIRNKPNISEEYRRKIYKPVKGIQTYRGTDTFLPSTSYYKHSVLSNYIAPTRLFNELNKIENSNTICNDLMDIDDVLKKKICPVKQKIRSVEPLETPKKDLWELSFKRWNHPSREHYYKISGTPVNKKPERYKGSLKSGLSSLVLMPVKRKPFTGKISNSGPALKKENTRLQSLSSKEFKRFPIATTTNATKSKQTIHFGGHGVLNARFNSLKIGGQPPEEKSKKSCNPNDALDFVCLSRAERGLHSRNQRGFRDHRF